MPVNYHNGVPVQVPYRSTAPLTQQVPNLSMMPEVGQDERLTDGEDALVVEAVDILILRTNQFTTNNRFIINNPLSILPTNNSNNKRKMDTMDLTIP